MMQSDHDAARGGASGPPNVRMARGRIGRWGWSLVLVLGGGLFGLIALFGRLTCVGIPAGADLAELARLPIPAGRTILERTTFLSWQGTSFLALATLAVALVIAGWAMITSLREARDCLVRRLLAGLFLLLPVAAVIAWRLDPGEDNVLQDLLPVLRAQSAPYAESGMGWTTVFPMRLAASLLPIFCVALLSTLVFPEEIDASILRERMRRQAYLLYALAATLVTVTLVQRAGYLWLFSFLVPGPQASIWPELTRLTNATCLNSGVFYSTCLIAFFWPANAQLLWLTRRLGEQARSSGEVADSETWVRKQRLLAGWKDVTGRLVAVLSPALASPVLALLGVFGPS